MAAPVVAVGASARHGPGLMGIVLVDGELRAGDAIRIELPAGARFALERV